jgi:hypothetical protein
VAEVDLTEPQAGDLAAEVDLTEAQVAAVAARPAEELREVAALTSSSNAPDTMPERDYSTTPLLKKLGIRDGSHVTVVAAPDAFEEVLGDLPESAVLSTRFSEKTKLALCFVRSLKDLSATLDMLTVRLPKQAHVWLIHPKRAGRYHADFNQNDVRDQALAVGLVDYKVCSVDGDWSGLKFAWRNR